METLNELLEKRKSIELKLDYYDKKLNEFNKNTSGLIPDEIRYSENFKINKVGFQIWFKELQNINLVIIKNHKKEYQLRNKN